MNDNAIRLGHSYYYKIIISSLLLPGCDSETFGTITNFLLATVFEFHEDRDLDTEKTDRHTERQIYFFLKIIFPHAPVISKPEYTTKKKFHESIYSCLSASCPRVKICLPYTYTKRKMIFFSIKS